MDDLTGRTLDAEVAEKVMGFRSVGKDDWGNTVYWGGKGEPPQCRELDDYLLVPEYSTDYNDCQLLRAEIERRGLVWEFMIGLNTIKPETWLGMMVDIQWRAMNATPEQQCLAALKAVQP